MTTHLTPNESQPKATLCGLLVDPEWPIGAAINCLSAPIGHTDWEQQRGCEKCVASYKASLCATARNI